MSLPEPAKPQRFSIKYKAYGETAGDYSSSPSSKRKKLPSEHVKEFLHPPLAQRDGTLRPKPQILERHRFSDQPYQLVSSVPDDEPLFQPFPPEINFFKYEPFKKYTTTLQLRNNDKVMRRVQVLSRDSEILKVCPHTVGNEIYSELGTNKVAYGMEVTFIITFLPESDEDYESELLIVTEREKYVVPVKCFGKRGVLRFPDEIVFHSTPLRCLNKKNMMIQNVGNKKAIFKAKATGPFSVIPDSGSVEGGGFFQCVVQFQPCEVGNHAGELEVSYNYSNECIYSMLTGIGCELDVQLSTGLAVAPQTFINQSNRMIVQLINMSSTVASFQWAMSASDFAKVRFQGQIEGFSGKFHPTDKISDVEYSLQDDQNGLDKEFIKSMEKAFTVTPAMGELWPGTVLEVCVVFNPLKPLRYLCSAYCVITGKANPLKLNLQGLGVGPQIHLLPSVIDLGKAYLYSVYTFTVEMQNSGELEAVYRLISATSSPMVRLTFHPDCGVVPPTETQKLDVTIHCDSMGLVNEMLLWEVEGALHNLVLEIKGNISGPEFSLTPERIDFGQASYGIESFKELKLQNCSPVCLSFSFQIICSDSNSLSTYAVSPKTCKLDPKDTKVLRVGICPMEEKKHTAELLVDLPEIGGSFASLIMEANCSTPNVWLSDANIDYGECFIRQKYSKNVILINESNVPAQYEVLSLEKEAQEVATCTADISIGMIPPNSKLPVDISFLAKCLGEIQISVGIQISGMESTPQIISIHAFSRGPALRIEKPKGGNKEPFEQKGDVEPPIDFGKVHVLMEQTLPLIVHNISCIPAQLKITLAKKSTVFKTSHNEALLQPFESLRLGIGALLDDAVKFIDRVKITVEGGQYVIPLKAIGVGSTIVSPEITSGIVDFGNQVTLRTFSYTFMVENKGRKLQSLSWTVGNFNHAVSSEPQKDKLLASRSVFCISPEKASIEPQACCHFTLTGHSVEPGEIAEDFMCNVVSSSSSSSHKMTVRANISPISLLLSPTEMRFIQNAGPEESSNPSIQPLTCTNLSKLPLDFTLNVHSPFTVSQTECHLDPSESITIDVGFQKPESKDKLSTVIEEKLEIVYTGATKRDIISLVGQINFPNLIVDAKKLQFGCVFENTCKRMHLHLENPGLLNVKYNWTFHEDDSCKIQVEKDTLDHSANVMLPVNHLFDILPICGFVQPGEKETVELSYNAYPGYQCTVMAVCEVEGGPNYCVELHAESGSIQYKISQTSFNFDHLLFNKTMKQTFTLANTGKVSLDFNVHIKTLRRELTLQILPSSGHLDPGSIETFSICVCPRVPEKFVEHAQLQVSHFLPHKLTILGEGVYPYLHLDLPRLRNHQFLQLIEKAWINLLCSTPEFQKQERTPLVEPQTQDSSVCSLESDTQKDLQIYSVHEMNILDEPHKNLQVFVEPTLEQIDNEIDRLMFLQSIQESNKEQQISSYDVMPITRSTEDRIDESEINSKIEKRTLNQYICDFGDVILGEIYMKAIKVSNGGIFPAIFKVDKLYLKGTGFNIEPQQNIKLLGKSSKSVGVTVTLKTDSSKFKTGLIEQFIPLHVREAPHTLVLLRANVTRPSIQLSNNNLEFGAVKLGNCKVMFIQLKSDVNIPCEWNIECPNATKDEKVNAKDYSAFNFTPSHGIIKPNNFMNVEVRFMPLHKTRNYCVKFHIKVTHNPNLFTVVCKGNSYNISFSLEPSAVELKPVIPESPQAAQYIFTLRNSCDHPIEVYSLDFDTQYQKEEEILRATKNYSEEEGILLLPLREAGEPFWESLIHEQDSSKGDGKTQKEDGKTQKEDGKTKKEDGKNQKSAKEKQPPPAQRRGTQDKKMKETAQIETKSSLDDIIETIFPLDTPFFLVHGPPLIGKSTQAELLTLKFRLPLIDLEDLILGGVEKQQITLPNDRIGNSDHVFKADEASPFERSLIKVIREKLKSPEYVHGAVFDNLQSDITSAPCLAKCLLFSIGLQPIEALDEIKGDSKIQWGGNPIVYVLDLEAERAGLIVRYSKIPENVHAKRKYRAPFVTNNFHGLEEDLYQRHVSYPFVSRIPSPKKLDEFFSSQRYLLDLLGDISAETTSRVKIAAINGLQDEAEVLEDELKALPSPGIDNLLPDPAIFQVVRRPQTRKPLVENIGLNYSFLTQKTKEDQENLMELKKRNSSKATPASQIAASKSKSDQMSDATSMKDEWVSIVSGKSIGRATKRGTTIQAGGAGVSPLNSVPEGYLKQARWVIPAHSNINLMLQFWAVEEKEYEHTFTFEMLGGGQTQAEFHCKAICSRPQISCQYKQAALPGIRRPSVTRAQFQRFIREAIMDFGALPSGQHPEGFPEIEDSEHSKVITVVNTGLFEAHVDFEIVQGADQSTVSQKLTKTAKKTSMDIFLFHPVTMDLKVDEKKDLRVYAYPSQDHSGTLEGKLLCRVTNNPVPKEYKLSCVADMPRVQIEPQALPFERLLLGFQDSKDFTIRNISALPIQWKIYGFEASKEVQLSETAGRLEAMCSTLIKVKFSAMEEKMIKEKLVIQVFNVRGMGKPSQEVPLSIIAEVYTIDVFVKYPNSAEEMPPMGGINFGLAKVAEDILKVLVLQNKGKYAISFKFISKAGLFSDLFTISPLEGSIDPKKEQKVEVHFNKEKKLKKEVNFQNNQDLQLHIIESLTGRTEQKLAIPITLKAVHSKFKIVPAHGIHFGPQVCSSISTPSSLHITNTGEFPFTFKLSAVNASESSAEKPLPSSTIANKDITKKHSEVGKGGSEEDKKGSEKGKAKQSTHKSSISKAPPETLELKSFTLSPSAGLLAPGAKQAISVYFKAETPGTISENVRILISDMDPLRYPEGVLCNIAGESCTPGIETNPEVIFEDYHIIDSVDPLGSIPPYGTYSKKNGLFSFGATMLCFADENTSKPFGNLVESRFKIQNLFSVPCSLQFSVTYVPEQQNQVIDVGEAVCPYMEVSPQKIDVPPLEHKFVICSFKPTSMQRYTATFEIKLKLEGEYHTTLFKCGLTGEGTLPHLFVDTPSLLSPLGFPCLKFPRLLLGRSLSLPIVLHNKGSVPATAKIHPENDNVDWMQMTSLSSDDIDHPFQADTEFTLVSQEKKKITVTFTPTAMQQYEQKLCVVINGNPFDRVCIQINGEGYSEEIVFHGLHNSPDNEILFEDSAPGLSSSIKFTMKNNAADKHWRFAWPDIPCIKFSPAVGHLLAGGCKEMLASFHPVKALEYMNSDVKLQVCNILLSEDVVSLNWDDCYSKPLESQKLPTSEDEKAASLALKQPEGRTVTKNEGKAKGEGGHSSADTEPLHEVVKGSAKVITLKLRAIADSARYECSTQKIQFKLTMMLQSRAFEFSLKNISHAVMQFEWEVHLQEGGIDRSNLYSVNPRDGLLQAGESVTVSVHFCPLEVEDCARLLVCNIPNLDQAYPPLQLPLTGQAERPWCHFELPKSDYAKRRSIDLPHPDDDQLGPLDPTIHVIEFESLGPNTRNIKYFIARNPTNLLYKFAWEPKQKLEKGSSGGFSQEPFKCLTKSGEISSSEGYEMAFEFSPKKIELQESYWLFKIPERKIEVPFLLVGNVQKPRVSFDHPIVNFGRVLVGRQVKHVLQLHNQEPVPFPFTFHKIGFTNPPPGQEITKPLLVFNPSTGNVSQSSVLPVEILFSPTSEGPIHVKAICNVKRASQLSISIRGEGYLFHEKVYMEAGRDGNPIELSPKEVNRVDFGQVLVNSAIFKKLVVTNSGNIPFQFLWECGSSMNAVNIEPLAGTVGRDEQVTCDLSFCPTSPMPDIKIPLTCQILHGNKYILILSATCYRPKVRLSFYEHDFGPCLLHHAGQEPSSTELTITNDGLSRITCQGLYENTTFVEVEATNVVLEPGQSHKVKILFKPDHIGIYKETLKFQIDGLDTINVVVSGEGTPILLDLVDPRQKLLTFGALKLGQNAKRQVQLINRGKVAVTISFRPSKEQLKDLGVACLPEEGLTVAPKQVVSFEVKFDPQSRIEPFSEGIIMEVVGASSKVLSVSGACLGTDVKLSSNILPFDSVALGSQATRKLKLENMGDFGTNFSWDLAMCVSEFSFFPRNGFLAPRQIATVDVIFHPTRVDPDVRVEHIPCLIAGGDTLYLTLIGACIECEATKEVIRFQTPVRTTTSKLIQIKNDTEMDWLIHPRVINDCWYAESSLVVPAATTVGFSVTYKPLSMSTHSGSILFPLPNGSALLYKLEGEAAPPLAEGIFRYETKARESLVVSLPIQNWSKETQHFQARVEQEKGKEGFAIIRILPEKISVAGHASKDCAVHFRSFKEGTVSARVFFESEGGPSPSPPREYLFFELVFIVAKAEAVQTLVFRNFVRQRSTQSIRLLNPLDMAVSFTSKCSCGEVTVPGSIDVPAKSSAGVEIAFRPLFEHETTGYLTFENALLGEYLYELKLKSVTVGAPPSLPLSFKVALGRQQTRALKFTHFLPSKCTYSCHISQEGGGEAGFSIDPVSVVAPPAVGPDGVELEALVRFEPTQVAEKVTSMISIKSTEGGEYKWDLEGSCIAPTPQGPFLIKSGSGSDGHVSFKNVFPRPAQFSYSVDNPAFLVSKGEKIGPNKVCKVAITYNSNSSNSSNLGRLTVSCPAETSYSWVFYLQGL